MSDWLAHTGYPPTAYGGSLFWIAHAICAVPCVTRGAIAVQYARAADVAVAYCMR